MKTEVHIPAPMRGDPLAMVAHCAAALAYSYRKRTDLLSETEASECIVDFRAEMQSVELKSVGKYTKLSPESLKYKERFMEEITKEATRQFIDIAYTALSDDKKQELANRFHGSLVRALNGALEPRLKELVMQYAMGFAEEAIAKHEAELRAKVTAEVDARWEKMVESVVQGYLSKAVEKIRAEMLRT